MDERQLPTVRQGADERIARAFDTASLGGSPTGVTCVLKSYMAGAYTDVSATNMTGSPSVDGNVIISPLIHSLTPGVTYRLEILFVVGGNTLEKFKFIEATL